MNDNSLKDYDNQIRNYIEKNLRIKNYEIVYKEEGAIPLFYPINTKEKNKINIGTAGGMTRLSTGYTFLNIQEHSKYIRMNIENIQNAKNFEIKKKYHLLDKIFLRVLEKYPEKMPNIFLLLVLNFIILFLQIQLMLIKILNVKRRFLQNLKFMKNFLKSRG